MSQYGDRIELLLGGLATESIGEIALGNDIVCSKSESQVSGILLDVEAVMACGDLAIGLFYIVAAN